MWTYAAITGMARMLVRTYYRWEHVGPGLPASGPLIVVGNHSNGLADAGLAVCTTRRPLRFVIKIGLYRMPVLGWLMRRLGTIPIYRQKDGEGTEGNVRAFAAAHDALERGEALSLFPEGTSHTDPRLRSFKTGAARMALGAEARADFQLGVQITPLAILYENPRRFRSRVTTCCGEPFGVERWREAYGSDEWGTVGVVTEESLDALRHLVPEVERLEERPLVRLAEHLLAPDGRSRPERWKAIADALDTVGARDPKRRARIVTRLSELDGRLAADGLTVDDLPVRGGRGAALATLSTAGPVLCLGALAWLPPILGVRAVARWVPLPPDKWVTVQLLATWVFVPLWAVVVGVTLLVVRGPGPAAIGLLALLAGAAAFLGPWPAVARAWRRLRAWGPDARPALAEAGPPIAAELQELLRDAAPDPERTSVSPLR